MNESKSWEETIFDALLDKKRRAFSAEGNTVTLTSSYDVVHTERYDPHDEDDVHLDAGRIARLFWGTQRGKEDLSDPVRNVANAISAAYRNHLKSADREKYQGTNIATFVPRLHSDQHQLMGDDADADPDQPIEVGDISTHTVEIGFRGLRQADLENFIDQHADAIRGEIAAMVLRKD